MPTRRTVRPDPRPLETDDVTVIAIGTAAWAAGLLVLLVLRVTGTADVSGWWLGMCCYGIALGLYGIHYCRRRHTAVQRNPDEGLPGSS